MKNVWIQRLYFLTLTVRFTAMKRGFQKIAKNATTSTKNMSASREKAVKSLEQIKAENEKKVQEIKESSKYYKTAKPGSLAEKAGMVAKYNEKNTKNGGKKN